jgi:hypothetical protein
VRRCDSQPCPGSGPFRAGHPCLCSSADRNSRVNLLRVSLRHLLHRSYCEGSESEWVLVSALENASLIPAGSSSNRPNHEPDKRQRASNDSRSRKSSNNCGMMNPSSFSNGMSRLAALRSAQFFRPETSSSLVVRMMRERRHKTKSQMNNQRSKLR